MRGNRATKPLSSPSPSTLLALPQPLHCLPVVGDHVPPSHTLACDRKRRRAHRETSRKGAVERESSTAINQRNKCSRFPPRALGAIAGCRGPRRRAALTGAPPPLPKTLRVVCLSPAITHGYIRGASARQLASAARDSGSALSVSIEWSTTAASRSLTGPMIQPKCQIATSDSDQLDSLSGRRTFGDRAYHTPTRTPRPCADPAA